MMKSYFKLVAVICVLGLSFTASAQRYQNGLIDKSVAVVGNEMISLSTLESEIQMQRAQGRSYSDANLRCEILESMLTNKLFLMQARVDSLAMNADQAEGQLSNQLDMIRTQLGGDEAVEAYFGKPIYRLRQEWRQQLLEQTLIQQERGQIAASVPSQTPYDVKQYLDTADVANLPMVPIKYQFSQISIYPDREAAAMEVKEKLLSLRERILNGEKFATLARIYSEDPGSARQGGELGLASRSVFWPIFSDTAMSLKPGTISQIVETPDGFHIIEVIEKKGDMFNARHILMKPTYTAEDREKAFAKLDSLKTEIDNKAVSFELAARFYSQDPASRTNGGQMADPETGSSYFEIDQLKPTDYEALKDLQVGEVSKPIESLDNEGRDGNLVYKIVRLDKVLDAHPATFENDFSLLSDMVLNEKRLNAIDDFVSEKIKSTYIIIDPMFADCDFNQKNWYDKIKK